MRDQAKECPVKYGPRACAAFNLTLCSDGSCQTICTSQQEYNNPCRSCPSQPDLSLKSCFTSPYVDILNYSPSNVTAQLYETCSSALGSPLITSTWTNTITPFWNVCEAPEGVIFPIQCRYLLLYTCNESHSCSSADCHYLSLGVPCVFSIMGGMGMLQTYPRKGNICFGNM